MMVVVEAAVGYVFVWLVRKARRVAVSLDEATDRVLDAGMEWLYSVVGDRLGADPALERARVEADGTPDALSDRTRRRLVDALDEAVEQDPDFAQTLAQAVARIEAVGPVDFARYTGVAKATGGGSASTGVVRPGGAGLGSATAESTGDATADGVGSKASTGVDYS